MPTRRSCGSLSNSAADPLLGNEDGTTPLMAAAGVGIWVVGESPGTNDEALEAVQLALELGGDVNASDDYGYTALHGAAHRGSPAIVQVLADAGARLDPKLIKSSPNRNGAKGRLDTADRSRRVCSTPTRSSETSRPPLSCVSSSRSSRRFTGPPGVIRDLQDVWDYWTFTPLERPEEFAGREALTEEEAALVGQQGHADALARDRDRPAEGSPGAYGQQVWTDRARATALTQPSLLVDPPGGKIPPITAAETGRLRGRPGLWRKTRQNPGLRYRERRS